MSENLLTTKQVAQYLRVDKFTPYRLVVQKKLPAFRVGNQVISNTGFESPCSTKGESVRFSPLETPSALCPPQEAGFTLNQWRFKRNILGQWLQKNTNISSTWKEQ